MSEVNLAGPRSTVYGSRGSDAHHPAKGGLLGLIDTGWTLAPLGTFFSSFCLARYETRAYEYTSDAEGLMREEVVAGSDSQAMSNACVSI